LSSDFRLYSDELDTDALQAEVASRVERRRRAGVYGRKEEARLAERLPDEDEWGKLSPIASLDYATTRALSDWEVSAAYPVDTERRAFRPLIILAKRVVRLWARIAVGPILREQTAFNRDVAAALEALRREALAQRARANAAEADLCALSETLTGEGEWNSLSGAVAGALAGYSSVAVAGPCPGRLAGALQEQGATVLILSAGTAWDDPPEVGIFVNTAPLSFLSQVAEGSIESLLVCDLAFWLRPAQLVRFARDSHLALADGGAVVVAVRRFAASGDAPAWCSPEVVEGALRMAGYSGPSSSPLGGDEPGGFVTIARKV
jgi:hypothetical protein